jgi:hypothetical protein
MYIIFPCYAGASHNDMARPRDAGGGDGLQIWRISANILYKHSQIADKCWFFKLGVGRGANKSSL